MLEESCKQVNTNESDVSKNKIAHKPIHRRSLSGSAVVSKAWHRRMKSDCKRNKLKLLDTNDDDNNRNDSVFSEMEQSFDSLSSSSGHTFPVSCQKSNSLDKSESRKDGRREKCHSMSTKMKIKHFLSEHIVKIHQCHHPEYHINKKDCDNNTSLSNLKNKPNNELRRRTSSDISLSNSRTSEKLKSDNDLNIITKPINIASTILDRIRHINIQPICPAVMLDGDQSSDTNATPQTHGVVANDSIDSQNDFPFPEPNPSNLPRVVSPCSIDFASKHILPDKTKIHKLPHSASCSQEFSLSDKYFNSHKKTLSLGPKFIPEKDKWEKKISGYLDTSTSTGATLTAINFGLKRVTETDKYVMITTSPTSCPNDFLEDGISHIEATSEIYQSLMRHSTCYDLMPYSGKVIVINSKMEIGRAFDAIEDNIVRASPIWSSEKQSFIALLTVNDLVSLLLHLHQRKFDKDCTIDDENCADDLSHVTVEKCLSIIPRFRSLQHHIVQVTPETNLQAVNILFNKFHRSMLLVIDSFLSGNPLFLLTDFRILAYLYYKTHTICIGSCFTSTISSSTLLADQQFQMLNPVPEEEQSCDHLSTLTKLRTQFLIHPTALICDVLRCMADSYYCCAMVVDNIIKNKEGGNDTYIIKNVITMADILNLIKIQKHNVESISANNILQYQREYHASMTYRDPVITCTINDSISDLINIIVKEKASFVLIRLYNDHHSPIAGIITVHDVLTYIDNLPYNATDLHNNVHDLSRMTKKHFNKDSERKGKQHSGNYWSHKTTPTGLSDFVEETVEKE